MRLLGWLRKALEWAWLALRRPKRAEVAPEPTAALLVAQEGLPAQLPRLIPLRRDRRAAWREFVKIQKQAKKAGQT